MKADFETARDLALLDNLQSINAKVSAPLRATGAPWILREIELTQNRKAIPGGTKGIVAVEISEGNKEEKGNVLPARIVDTFAW